MHSSPGSATPKGSPSRTAKSPKFSAAVSPTPVMLTATDESSTSKPKTFTSSLKIPVEGAIPLGPDGAPLRPTPAGQPQLDASSEPKRATRKSKTDALAALSTQGRSPSEDRDGVTSKHLDGSSIIVNPPLDLSTVKTPGSRKPISKPVPTRPFGIQDCPEYYPTLEEFKDPMGYIKSISGEAQEYGICKIVPPEGWNMPFVTDTETFRFKTRVQTLNSIEASSRAKLNFLEQLYRYHKQQGNPRVVVPTVNHKPIDLWLLRKEVQRLGGYDAVTKAKKWPDLGRLLGYGGIPGLSTQIKNSYTRVILPYEHFCERVRSSPTLAPLLARDNGSKAVNSHAPVKPSKLGSSANGVGSEPSSPLTDTSSPLSDVPDEADKEAGSSTDRLRRSLRSEDKTPGSKPNSSIAGASQAIPSPVFYDKVNETGKESQEHSCEVCHKKNRGEEMLLCDGCDCGFHMFCLDPPLSAIPKDQWFCYTCIAGTGGDYGFDEGEEHSLSSFQARDREFRRQWFETHPPVPSLEDDNLPEAMVSHIGDVRITEYDVEQEFWRLVQSQYETVEIEYGADVHSTTHGSGMPTIESHPLEPYSKDPWNLNNIAIVPDSLLRYIKSEISGMTVPWTYVGMTFSTFCWHNEDHYTHSINFMHWGETKTWYGIPGEDAAKFEAAIKYEAPDLFEAQPDLLFQLVTLMNPKRVRDAGVRVYGCNQRAGEFVITFPKAYHAGFNHGINFNEAVNFALPEWLVLGLDCAKRYREHRKLPVFSHDELLITITQQSSTIRTALWLSESLQEMVNREMADRSKARQSGMKEKLVQEDHPEDEYQCTVCKVFCYLSQVTCACHSKVVCVDHTDLLCDKSQSKDHHTLRLRFTDAELLDLQRKVHERAASPIQWKAKLDKLLMESSRPPLRSLRALLAEGDRIGVQYRDLTILRKCVNKANEWVDQANASFLLRKQSRIRARKSARGRADVEQDTAERGLDELYALLKDVDRLGFDSPEISSLRTLAAQAEEVKTKAENLLQVAIGDQGDTFLQECKIILLNAESINVRLEELGSLVRIVDREKLLKELGKITKDTPLTLEEVRKYLSRAHSCELPPDHPHIRALEDRLQEGHDWEENAIVILNKPIKTVEEMQSFLDKESAVPMDPAVLDRLASAHAKALDFDRQADAWLALAPGAPKPRLTEVLKLISRAEKEYDISSIRDLKKATEIAQDLETRCEQVLKNTYDHKESDDVFKIFREWRAYANDHLNMFHLPVFTRMEHQLDIHQKWLEELPWFCADHKLPHTEVILEEILKYCSPEDDVPPTDKYFTCLCLKPVRPPASPTDTSDAVQCDHCYARFHPDCVPPSMGSCPFCDHSHWNGTFPNNRPWHSYYFPSILMKAPDISKHYSTHWRHLQFITHRLDRLCNVIGTFLMFASQPVNQKYELLAQTRHFMRKLYKLEFAVSPSPDVSFGLDLAGLHRILAHMPPSAPVRPKKKRRLKFVFGQDTDNDWSDGTRCICRGRTNYLLNYPSVECSSCKRRYHAGCVFFSTTNPSLALTCPICCLRKGTTYPYSDVRVKPNPTSEDARDPERYINTKAMIESLSSKPLIMKLKLPTRPTLFVELVEASIEEYDDIPRAVPGMPHSNGGGANGPTAHGAPPPWANNASRPAARRPQLAEPYSARGPDQRIAPHIEADESQARIAFPPPPRSPSLAGPSQGSPFQAYDPRASKKRKVDDLQKFNGDVALYGAHGDHAGNRRWNERQQRPVTQSSSAGPQRAYPGDVSTRQHTQSPRGPSHEAAGPPGSRGASYAPLPRRDTMDRHLDDNAYRGSKRKAPEDEGEAGYHHPSPPVQAASSVAPSASPSSPRARGGAPALSPSLAMLMSPQHNSPPPVSRRAYGGDSPIHASVSTSNRGGSSTPLPPIQTSVPQVSRPGSTSNGSPTSTRLPPINAMIRKQP